MLFIHLGIFIGFTGFNSNFIFTNYGGCSFWPYGTYCWTSGHAVCNFGWISIRTLSRVCKSHLNQYGKCLNNRNFSQSLRSKCWISTIDTAKIGCLQSRWTDNWWGCGKSTFATIDFGSWFWLCYTNFTWAHFTSNGIRFTANRKRCL